MTDRINQSINQSINLFVQKQARSQRSLEMLLGVVEENRKKEVMENLGVCAQLVEKIKRELTELEGTTDNTLIIKGLSEPA